jgi:hypothetical protein
MLSQSTCKSKWLSAKLMLRARPHRQQSCFDVPQARNFRHCASKESAMSRCHARFANAFSSARRLLFGAALMTLVGLTPAHAQTSRFLGRITEAKIPSNGLKADFKRASRFTLPGRGTITMLCAYLDGNGGVSGNQVLRLALYTDNNGVPGTKVYESEGEVIEGGSAARWYCSADVGPIMSRSRERIALFPVAAGTYWIAIHTSGTGGVIRDFGDGPSNWYGNADAFDDRASSTFGAGRRGTGTLSVYAQYFPDSQLRHAGRTTIGAVPSKGMTADFKRGSSFLLPEPGRPYALTAYIGGSPDNRGPSSFRFSIYQDANNVPDTKLYEAGRWSVTSPSHPLRFTDRAFLGNLDAGRYWFVIHTGAVSGSVRNFGDGSAGNWYGNSDTFEDGASQPFGPGAAGNGTIAAFMSYRPGQVTTGQLGRTDVGTKPSRGLKANFSRGSEFFALEGGTLTGLHAYLDGLGGASGSQKIRMVIYGLFNDNGDVFFGRIAQSADVTITAGTPARWVHFAVPPVALNSNWGPFYRIAMQSGDTAGVVRDFGDSRPVVCCGPPYWFGLPDAFADGAVDDPGMRISGEPALSVYATFSYPPPE